VVAGRFGDEDEVHRTAPLARGRQGLARHRLDKPKPERNDFADTPARLFQQFPSKGLIDRLGVFDMATRMDMACAGAVPHDNDFRAAEHERTHRGYELGRESAVIEEEPLPHGSLEPRHHPVQEARPPVELSAEPQGERV